jgi:hypothetical protein
MIRYTLVCNADHEFDGWFRSSEDFEAQATRGLVQCGICGSTKVERGLMAPNVVTSRSRAPVIEHVEATAPAAAAPAAQEVVVAPDPRQKAIIEALGELKRQIIASSDNVGDKFAEEARKIHYGEAPERGIYGQATGEEAMALIEEGIEVHALPVLPDEQN